MPDIKINYQKKMEETLAALTHTPRLLLHACCAPCSSYVLEYLTKYFDITLLFYNPNIDESAEYEKRLCELARLINTMPLENPVSITNARYNPQEFLDIARGYESEPERGARCARCFNLRLSETARVAREGNFDFFTTTLSISPHKDADLLNKIGAKCGETHGVSYLYADFKKRGGYKRSTTLSREYDLYRQDFCGCKFSKKA